jgi:hypothetical protein
VPQLFSRTFESSFRAALGLALLAPAGAIAGLMVAVRSPYLTDEDVAPTQPIQFSHQHHVGDDGIDCRYCHASVETEASAGMPSTQVCMNCHRLLWRDSEALAKVRRSWKENVPIRWVRVHDLPDYVYFHHGAHVQKGIGCYECHGRIDEMPSVRQEAPLTMEWCLDCHREPEERVRPRTLVFQTAPLDELVDRDDPLIAAENLPFEADSSRLEDLRAAWAESYDVHSRTDCYTCHR